MGIEMQDRQVAMQGLGCGHEGECDGMFATQGQQKLPPLQDAGGGAPNDFQDLAISPALAGNGRQSLDTQIQGLEQFLVERLDVRTGRENGRRRTLRPLAKADGALIRHRQDGVRCAWVVDINGIVFQEVRKFPICDFRFAIADYGLAWTCLRDLSANLSRRSGSRLGVALSPLRSAVAERGRCGLVA